MRKVIIGAAEMNLFTDSYLISDESGEGRIVVFASFVGVKSHIENVIDYMRSFLQTTKSDLKFGHPDDDDKFIEVNKTSRASREFIKKTPGEKFHGIYLLQDAIYQNVAPTGFYLIGNSEKECRDKFFGYLSRYPVPLHKSWAKSLWRIFKKEGWLNPLTGYNKTGFKVYFKEKECLKIVSDAIKKRKLLIAEDLWKKGGIFESA